jgi:hypothetical protein
MLKFIALFFVLQSVSFAASTTNEQLTVAESFGYSEFYVLKASRRVNALFDVGPHLQDIAVDLEDFRNLPQKIDGTIASIIAQSDVVLRAYGFNDYADKITREYQVAYAGWLSCYASMCSKEIGDHPPLWQWLAAIHDGIESRIGENMCKFFHLHDLYILNHAVPVVLHPVGYELADYLDHFAGHMKNRFSWEHHGLAGVVTYWAVQTMCTGATAGLGLISFACGPISDISAHVMDKRLAPPVASRIWERARHDLDNFKGKF